MKGKSVPFISGWDSHELYIEAKVEENYTKKDCKKRCGFSCLPQSLLQIRRVLN
jgi:isoleucyl-tRNA synthetase